MVLYSRLSIRIAHSLPRWRAWTVLLTLLSLFTLFLLEVQAGSGAPPSSSSTADDTASLAGVPGANEEEADITEAMQSPHHMLSVQ